MSVKKQPKIQRNVHRTVSITQCSCTYRPRLRLKQYIPMVQFRHISSSLSNCTSRLNSSYHATMRCMIISHHVIDNFLDPILIHHSDAMCISMCLWLSIIDCSRVNALVYMRVCMYVYRCKCNSYNFNMTMTNKCSTAAEHNTNNYKKCVRVDKPHICRQYASEFQRTWVIERTFDCVPDPPSPVGGWVGGCVFVQV